MRLWDLPGPRRFVDSTCQSLRGGSSVVIRFPGAVPDGFDDALTRALGNALQVGDLAAGDAPCQDLTRAYAAHPSHVRSLADLCDDEGFRGRLVRLHGIDGNNWPAWRDFLVHYAQLSRSRDLLGRSLFLVPLHSYPSLEPPPPDVGLSIRTWDRVLGDIDLLLLASERLGDRSSDLLGTLLATSVARVAAWDFDTASALVAQGNRTILNPTEFLRSWARERGWTDDTPLDWGLGTASRSGLLHPARAALDEPPTEIHRRVWSAQLSVLLPWIETRRLDTVADNIYELRRHMREAGDGQRDAYELELGELSALFSRRGADRDARRTFRRLRDVRNKLAHREHLAPDTVFRLLGDEGDGTVNGELRRWP